MKRECLLLSLFLAALLAGCGDDVSANDDENDGATPTTMTDERDGQVYRIVTIGEQVWMAENLRYVYKDNGVVRGNWCPSDNPPFEEEGDCSKYGRFYNLEAAMDYISMVCDEDHHCDVTVKGANPHGVCPNGWHLPDWGEWRQLFHFVGGESVAATALKSSSGWDGNGNGTDAYGFSALPAGRQYGSQPFVRDNAYFWIYMDDLKDDAPCVTFLSGAEALKWTLDRYTGLSVRCVKDSD